MEIFQNQSLQIVITHYWDMSKIQFTFASFDLWKDKAAFNLYSCWFASSYMKYDKAAYLLGCWAQ